MNILSPATNPDEVNLLIRNGASEIYCGIISKEWLKKYQDSPNARSKLYSNLRSFDSLRKVVKNAHSLNAPVYVTFNNHYFSYQYPSVLSEIKKAINCDIDGIILSDIFLLNHLKDEAIKLHWSSRSPVFNSYTVRFLKGFNIDRIILPRQLTISEIKDLASSRNVGFEMFITNSKCRNTDGFCCYHHIFYDYQRPFAFLKKSIQALIHQFGLKKDSSKVQVMYHILLGDIVGCNLSYRFKAINKEKIQVKKYKKISSFDYCAACYLYEVRNLNIKSLKIVGRENTTEKKLKDVKFIKSILSYLDTSPDKNAFLKYTKQAYKEVYHKNCDNRCYFN